MAGSIHPEINRKCSAVVHNFQWRAGALLCLGREAASEWLIYKPVTSGLWKCNWFRDGAVFLQAGVVKNFLAFSVVFRLLSPLSFVASAETVSDSCGKSYIGQWIPGHCKD